MSSIAENHLMVKLGELARMLPSNEARAKLYEVAEGLMHVAVANGIFCGLAEGAIHAPFGGGDSAKVGLTSSLAKSSEWTDYLVKEGAKYRQA